MSLRNRLLVGAVAAATVPAVVTSSPSAAADAEPAAGRDRACVRAFDRAVDAYVGTTLQRDADGFNALLAEDVTAIFADGGVLDGRAQVAEFIDGFFADPDWTQTFVELKRTVAGCRTGFVLLDSVYAVPSQGQEVPLVVGLSFTFERGRWLLLHNQDSDGPASR